MSKASSKTKRRLKALRKKYHLGEYSVPRGTKRAKKSRKHKKKPGRPVGSTQKRHSPAPSRRTRRRIYRRPVSTALGVLSFGPPTSKGGGGFQEWTGAVRRGLAAGDKRGMEAEASEK